jgi:CheY-like chemotaxis protein
MIVLVDDEPRQVDSYVRELELSGYAVVLQEDVDKALEFVEERRDEIDLLILDIIMPPGVLGDADTQKGLRSGLKFFDRVRLLAPALPVLILTNVSDPHAASHFRGATLCWFLLKEECLPYELVEEVGGILAQADRGGK